MEGGKMRGTLMCAVSDGEESADALELGAQLSERLGLRLVLAHAVDGIDAIDDDNESVTNNESVTMKANREGAERRLARLAEAHGLAQRAERRVAVGQPAALLGQIAAEEAVDIIVVGAPVRGWRKRLETRLADDLGTETPVPVLIAPPRTRRG
jgi:nucleotide-binding universal stress UspA family protein